MAFQKRVTNTKGISNIGLVTGQSTLFGGKTDPALHFDWKAWKLSIPIRVWLNSGLSMALREDWPKSAFFPFSSGRKRLSTAQTRMCSGMLGDLAPTSSNPAGTSSCSVATETSRRSLPAWQNPGHRGVESAHNDDHSCCCCCAVDVVVTLL